MKHYLVAQDGPRLVMVECNAEPAHRTTTPDNPNTVMRVRPVKYVAALGMHWAANMFRHSLVTTPAAAIAKYRQDADAQIRNYRIQIKNYHNAIVANRARIAQVEALNEPPQA